MCFAHTQYSLHLYAVRINTFCPSTCRQNFTLITSKSRVVQQVDMSVSRATEMFVLKRYTETERLTPLNCFFTSGISGKHLPPRGNFTYTNIGHMSFSVRLYVDVTQVQGIAVMCLLRRTLLLRSHESFGKKASDLLV